MTNLKGLFTKNIHNIRIKKLNKEKVYQSVVYFLGKKCGVPGLSWLSGQAGEGWVN